MQVVIDKLVSKATSPEIELKLIYRLLLQYSSCYNIISLFLLTGTEWLEFNYHLGWEEMMWYDFGFELKI